MELPAVHRAQPITIGKNFFNNQRSFAIMDTRYLYGKQQQQFSMYGQDSISQRLKVQTTFLNLMPASLYKGGVG